MSKESPDELKEKSTVLNHLATAAFPAEHLAPWMSTGKKQEVALRALLRTIGDSTMELDRQIFMLKHPELPKPEADMPEEIFFDSSKVSGGPYMLAYVANSLGQNLHDFAVSEEGLGRRQAMHYGSSLKSGQAVEPKKRSLWDKMTGKNKDANQVSGGG